MKKILAVVLVAVMAMALATTAFAVEKKDAISGDLTVTGFFNEKTDAVELKDGETLTIKFQNKTNGTNNYENYVLAITSAVGEAYTGFDQEVLIIRADNFAWGGGSSDFSNPWATTKGNIDPVYDTDINWDNWVVAMQAGVAVEINLSRDGNTIKYEAKIGDFYDNITATSTVGLPDDLYVFLTGENCVLTGITTTNNGAAQGGNTGNGGNTTAPKTGFATVALAIAAIGSGAYVVSKKKH